MDEMSKSTFGEFAERLGVSCEQLANWLGAFNAGPSDHLMEVEVARIMSSWGQVRLD